MTLRLLGPPEFVVADEQLDLGGSRQRIIFTMLALNHNRVTTIEQLIDAVWSTLPPTSARTQIQIGISMLRKAFGDAHAPAKIKTRPPGYQLEVDPHELDLEQFHGLVAIARVHSNAGRDAVAVATLRMALALWRGAALAGVPSELVRRSAAQLEDERLTAVMERLRLALALGWHEDLISELAALVREYPLRERMYEYLMLALYRSDRQAEALEVCRNARSTLVAELGIEPAQGLQRLETAILNRDPALDLGSPDAEQAAPDATTGQDEHHVAPRLLPASVADFTGRREQLDDIKHVLSGGNQATRYGMRIVAISGKGGVGKSTLAIRAAHELRELYPDGHLYGDLEAPDDEDRVSIVLSRFLRVLGLTGAAVPEDVEEKADMYRSRLAGKRMLVVLDGATDESQILRLLPAGSGCAVIATSRARMTCLPGARLMDIDVFDIDHAMEMLTRMIGSERVAAEHAAAVELATFCGGLPLAMRIAGARLVSRPHWRLGVLVARLRDTAGRLDEFAHRGLELRPSIDITYLALSDESKRLFRLFALTTMQPFPGWIAAALLDIDLHDATEVLESLIEAQLVETVQYPGEHVRYRFHDLLRVYAGERLDAEEDPQARHEAVVRMLGAWVSYAEQAHRKEYGGDYTILHGEAPRWSPPDGEFGIDDPMEWLEAERRTLVSAVRLAATRGLDELCWDLALTSVSLFEVKGYFDEWRETAEVALDAVEQAGNRRGRAATLYSLGTMHMSQKRLGRAEEYFDDALRLFRADEDVHGCALVLRHAAAIDRMRGRSTTMLAKYREALGMMRKIGDPVGEAHILRSLAKFWIDEGDMDNARKLLDRALDCCRQVHYLRGEAQVVTRFAELYLSDNQVEEAHQALNRVLLIVRDIGDHIGEAHALYGLGVIRQRTGRLDNAETTMRHALSLSRRAGERLIEGQSLYALGDIELARGNSTAGATHLEAANKLFEELGSTVWHAKTLILLSDVHQGHGEIDQASRAVEQAMALLRTADSRQATRLRLDLENTRAALPAQRSQTVKRDVDPA